MERERTFNTTPHGDNNEGPLACAYVQYRAKHTHACMYVCMYVHVRMST